MRPSCQLVPAWIDFLSSLLLSLRRQNVPPAKAQAAVGAVGDGTSYRMAGVTYGISKSSITTRPNDNVGMGASVGPAAVLTRKRKRKRKADQE
eukprot:jgi/Undpi1/421/HiC_scaffold_1.g00417.m1